MEIRGVVLSVLSLIPGAAIAAPPSTVALTRQYVYDAHQRLCKIIEPETGATVFGHDAAGNVLWSAAGLSLPDTTQCDHAAAWHSGRRVDREYDARNRIVSLSLPDGRGDQSWAYTADGLAATVTTDNDNTGGARVVNAYTYNARRLLTGESVEQPGWYTWAIGYGYDRNAHLAVLTCPTGPVVQFAPNAVGQPTRAGDFARDVRYHSNGAVAGFTYGNGLVHTMAQNARHLPAGSHTTGNAFDHVYRYDANGNVVAIEDLIVGTPTAQHRYMGYDGLNRLAFAGSAMFGGSDHTIRYGYDALDNLTSIVHAGVREHVLVFDVNNRLTNIVDRRTGASVDGLGYDALGNLANRNGQRFYFDNGNRLRAVHGKENYKHDAFGRRVQSQQDDGNSRLYMYGQGGQLLFEWRGLANEATTHYVHLGDTLVATVERAWPLNGQVKTRYQHTDALGSPVAVSDEMGRIVERTNYDPRICSSGTS